MKRWMIGAGLLTAVAVPAIAMQAGEHHDHKGFMGPVKRTEVQAKVAERFAAFDANKDGAVTKAEADAHRAAMKAQRRAELFAKLDTDKNGQLSKSEFSAPWGERGEGKHERWGRGHHGGGGRMGMMGGRWFDHMDANKDGKVTLAEATAQALAHFDQADANKDGTVTPEERRSMFEKMRDAWKGKGG